MLVRYGVIPEFARFSADEVRTAVRGECVVLETHRGMLLGTVLDTRTQVPTADTARSQRLLRLATEADLARRAELRREAEAAYPLWQQRIRDWQLDLELIDLEWTLDRAKLILYVLNDRGPDCTKLALQAAAAGLGTIEVQPVSAEGLVTQTTLGGCGSCGCG